AMMLMGVFGLLLFSGLPFLVCQSSGAGLLTAPTERFQFSL
ncbi:hypothetical protein S1OALGB6SA_71, partial [Olavius algarvensis spirochete endosymbiont]